MKRIGILTLYYKTYNYGAQLQSYALQKAISSLDYECEQIAFKWYQQHLEEFYTNSSIDTTAFDKFAFNIPHSRRVYTPDNIYECIQDYDCFVCGSDQIWGVEHSMPPYVLPLMALSFVPDDKTKIAYAGSMGGAAVAENKKYVLASALKKLDAISVREQSATEYLSELADKETVPVIDPVMLLTKESWNELAGENIKTEKYLFLYYVGKNPEVKKKAEEFAEKENLEVITFSYVNDGIASGPKEFVNYIKYAEYVITDSFHATVLSIIFEKQFITFAVDNILSEYSKNIRITDLLNKFGLFDRFIQSSAHFDFEQIYKEINYDNVRHILSEERNKSFDFLKKNLSISKATDDIVIKKQCIGCLLCSEICPEKCITVNKDILGFEYPSVDKEKCILCGKCKEVCPVLSRTKSEEFTVKAYGAYCIDERVRNNSSSGGVFFALAFSFIKNGGVVFACHYNNEFKVEHALCDTVDKLDDFCRSKYVQSRIVHIIKDIEKFLNNTKVMFVGTPCQVAAIKNYFGDDCDNLFTVDLICGGVTAPELWNKYLTLKSNSGRIKEISMRDKAMGFLNSVGYPASSMKIQYEDGKTEVNQNVYDYFLHSRLTFYRDNCYECSFKGVNHQSDITLGDFCGIEQFDVQPEYINGVTLVLVQNEKGKNALISCNNMLELKEYDVNESISHNPMCTENMKKRPYSDYLRLSLHNSSIEKIFYENDLFNYFLEKEQLFRNLQIEYKRNSLYQKTLLFKEYGLSLNDVPEIREKIVIYGAGKIGKIFAQSKNNKIEFFIDGRPQANAYNGVTIFKIGSDELSKIIMPIANQTTVIVTPTWDMWQIREDLLYNYPGLSVISLEEVVKNIYVP